jgi:hypothetical protein
VCAACLAREKRKDEKQRRVYELAEKRRADHKGKGQAPEQYDWETEGMFTGFDDLFGASQRHVQRGI